jgi:hypothetical protein
MPGLTEERVVEEFDVRDTDGNRRTVLKRTIFVESIRLRDTPQWLPTKSSRYNLADGTQLNQDDRDPDKFETAGRPKIYFQRVAN